MGGGKSYVLRWAALLYLIYLWEKYKIQNIPVGLFSEDYPTLKDRQIARIKREFPVQLGELKDTRDEGLIYKLNDRLGGGRIMLRNLDDPAKYMSTEFAGEFVEELTRNPQQTFEDLRNRLRYPGIEEVKFMGASNPGGIGHGYVKKFFIDKNTNDPEQSRFFYVHANVYDNKYISPDYIKQLESLPEAKRKAYLEGSWDVFAGQVFTEFSRERHTVLPFIPKRDKLQMIIGGLDWGRTAPFAVALTAIQEKKHEGRVFYRAYTFSEVYGTNKRPAEWAKIINNTLSFYNLTLDSIDYIKADTQIFDPGIDSGKSILDQFADYDQRFSFKLQRADKSPQSRILGWENLHNWLSLAPDGLPYWLITQNCTNLIRTLPELVYDETRKEDVDTTGEDHIADAVRYMFRSLKWIDAKVGGYSYNNAPRMQKTVNIDPQTGKEISLDIDKFITASTQQQNNGVWYPD